MADTKYSGPTHTFHRAKREALIASGMVKPEHFPGEPGQKKTAAWFVDAEGRKIRVTKCGKQFRVYTPMSQEEIERLERETEEWARACAIDDCAIDQRVKTGGSNVYQFILRKR